MHLAQYPVSNGASNKCLGQDVRPWQGPGDKSYGPSNSWQFAAEGLPELRVISASLRVIALDRSFNVFNCYLNPFVLLASAMSYDNDFYHLIMCCLKT